MSHFVDQYIHFIQMCEDYDLLADRTLFVVSKNVFQFVNTDIREKMLSLSLSMPFDNFIHELVDAAVLTTFNETALNLLTEFCNRICKEYDSLTFNLSEYVVLVITLCADDKTFIRKLSRDCQEKLVYSLMRSYLCICDDDLNPEMTRKDLIVNTCIDSMDKILNGATLDDLDKEYAIIYSSIPDEGSAQMHVVGELIRPFQSIFMNVCHNIDKMRYLTGMSVAYHNKKLDDYIKENARAIYKNREVFGLSSNVNNEVLSAMEGAMLDLLTIFKMYNDDVIKNNATELITKESGLFILSFIEWVHGLKEYTPMIDDAKLKKKLAVLLISLVLQALDATYAMNEDARRNIGHIVVVYQNSEESEDRLLQHEFLKAIKLHAVTDPAYKELCIMGADMLEDNAVTNVDRMNDTMSRVFATYISPYRNPLEQEADRLIQKDALNKPEVVSSDDVVTEASKSQSWDDENSDEDSNDSDYDEKESEVEATQSKTGYKKSSKNQAERQRKIYSAYKKYKNNEEKVDSQLSKMLTAAKSAFAQDKTEEIIEGKKFSPIGLLKKILVTGAIFSYSKIAGFIYLITRHTLSKKRTSRQKQEVLLQLNEEIKLLDEKIEDARGDGNRQAKYAMMRTRGELQRTYDKIKYDLGATKNDLSATKSYLKNAISSKNK